MTTRRPSTPWRLDALVVGTIALVTRLAVIAWAAPLFPPTADGAYYDVVARRIAAGQGYTWLWPDGVVTFAAHYPVGYPALVGLAYAAFGASTVTAMLLNALFGVVGAVSIFALLRQATSRRLALVGAVVFALHPALLLYTPALMTEGVTASLLAAGAAIAGHARTREPASHARTAGLIATGLVMGAATLVRPQAIVLAPVLGWFAVGPSAGPRTPSAWWQRFGKAVLAAGLVTGVALAVCAPWTVRNCVRMDRCALVSVNGGWNLAIGAQTTSGAWSALAVPEACKEVFQEAAKDTCFGHDARRTIGRAPLAWLAKIPAKLGVTFDYFGAAPWYLHEANPAAFSERAKVALGTVETVVSRILLALALVAVARLEGPRRRSRLFVCGLGLVASFVPAGAIGYVALALAVALLGLETLSCLPVIVPFTGAAIAATAATHAVFFGAGRYGLVVVPFVTALAFVRRPSLGTRDDCQWATDGPSCPPSMPLRRSPVCATSARKGAQREESPSSTECDAG